MTRFLGSVGVKHKIFLVLYSVSISTIAVLIDQQCM